MSETGVPRTGGPEQEAEWIRRIAAGDRRAFEELYEVYSRRVFRFMIRMVRDEARAEELVNDVLVEVWKSAGRFEGRSKPSTWIFGIAHHKGLNALRGRKFQLTELDEAHPVADPVEGADAAVHRATLRKRVRTALDGLSHEHRAVVELTFFQGLSYPEIAEVVGCPTGTVKTRMFHAKKRLGPLLAELAASEDSG
jgi:RNA polymerase sigma-70 factor (ECF subfamily)